MPSVRLGNFRCYLYAVVLGLPAFAVVAIAMGRSVATAADQPATIRDNELPGDIGTSVAPTGKLDTGQRSGASKPTDTVKHHIPDRLAKHLRQSSLMKKNRYNGVSLADQIVAESGQAFPTSSRNIFCMLGFADAMNGRESSGWSNSQQLSSRSHRRKNRLRTLKSSQSVAGFTHRFDTADTYDHHVHLQSFVRSRRQGENIRRVDFQPRAELIRAVQANSPDERRSPMDRIGPFEVIAPETTEITVRARRNILLQTKFDVFRTAIVDPSICDLVQFTPREVSIIGRSVGVTNITFWFHDGERNPVTYVVRVVADPSARITLEDEYALLADLLSHLFPDSKVYLVPLADKLIVKGQAKDSEEAAQIMQIIRGETGAQTTRGGNLQQGRAAQVLTEEETGGRQSRDFNVVNMLRVPGAQQVALRVKIAELNRSAARGFGVNVDAEINLSDTAAMFIESMLNAASGAGPSLLSQVDGDDITFGLRWLEQEGVARLLSEPTLVTMSGRPATFVAGGEFAVPTIVGAGGISAVTTEFRAFGAIISFLPIVIDKDRIRLEVSPEFSQINTDLNVGDNLGLNVRAVTTTVEMREGQTLAIAGLLDETMTGTKVGELPLLSHILGNRDTSRNETELIILVTPELIHPMEPEEVPPLPGFDITEPNNTEFFLHGHLEGIPTREYRSTLWPRLRRRYQGGGPAMISGPFGHGQ